MNITKNTVKITTLEKNAGSGFIYKIDSGFVYIFTARHVLLDDGEIEFPSAIIKFRNNLEYTLTPDDIVIFGDSKVNEQDVALIIIPHSKIEFEKDEITVLEFIDISNAITNISCCVSGFPNATREQFLRTLNQCNIVKDKDFKEQIQIESTDPIMSEYNLNVLFLGYSGSCIFIKTLNAIYVIGIVTSFENNTKRIKGIIPSAINSKIRERGFRQIEFKQVELNDDRIKDVEKINNHTTNILNRIQDKIGTIHLDRTALRDDIVDLLKLKKNILITGKAGVGKSAIIKQTLSFLSEQYSIIVLKGEDVDREDLSSIAAKLQINNDIEDILDTNEFKKDKIVLIDSFEKLLETDNADTIFDFFDLINKRENIKLIITCRSYAVEQLKIRFINVFRDIDIVSIPVLSDEELSIIKEVYPNVSSLLEKHSIKEILKIPFNIDKIIHISKTVLSDEVTTEKQLKQLMWSYIIEGKASIANSRRQQERGDALVRVAMERAKAMLSYIAIPSDIELDVIQSLERDNLIVSDNFNYYTLSHDIYEDWALTKYIEVEYSQWTREFIDIQLLFNAIGNEPAIRRAFRIWIYEKLQEIDFDVKQLVTSIITNTQLESYWIDETIIAIIQSTLGLDFFDENKSILYESDFKIFRRILLLLKVACQETNYSLIDKLEGENKLEIYQSYCLMPAGNGWPNVIQFIYNNLHDFDEISLLIIDTLLSWANILNNIDSENLKESECVGRILLHHYHNRQNIKDYPYKECIVLLFKLVGVIKEDVERIIIEELVLDLDEKALYDSLVIKHSLSWHYSKELAKHIPETLIEVMEKKWFNYPDKEKFKEYHSILDYSYYSYREPTKDEQCGVADNEYSFNYYPSSAYQTPIYHLLNHNPYQTLKFIVKLYDHSISIYMNYGYDIKEIKIEYEEYSITQYGNQELWYLYRQGTSFSDLLECVLMALERWLLYMAKLSEKEGFEFLKDFLISVFLTLIQSQNIAITSVLASVSIAYPYLFKDKVLMLLQTQEFFLWDRSRYSQDLVFAIYIDENQHPIQSKERLEAKNMSHRKKDLEFLMLALANTDLGVKIYSILDDFYAKEPTNSIWRIALNRMDFRKREVVGKTDQYAILMPKIDEDLKPSMDSMQKQIEVDHPFLNLSTWARNVHEKKKTDATYSEWQKHYEYSSNKELASFYNSPGTLAAVGLRDFYNELSDAERKWSIETVLDIINKILKTDYSSHADYYVLDKSPVLSTLPLLIKLKGNSEAKRMLFYCMIYLRAENDIKTISEGIRDNLHPLDDKYLYTSLAGVIQYAKLKNEYYSDQEKLQVEIDKLMKALIDNDICISYEDISFEDLNIIIYGLFFIPAATINIQVVEFIKKLLTLFIDNLQKENSKYRNKEISFEVKWYFEQFISKFILNQSIDVAIEVFDKILNCVYLKERFYNRLYNDFVKSILFKIIIEVDQEHSYSGKFKLIWAKLHKKNAERKNQLLSDYLLLYGDGGIWNKNIKKWIPIEDTKFFFKRVIYDIKQIKLISSFLSGVGFTETLPDGVHWYADLLRGSSITIIFDKMELFYTERLVQRLFYDSMKRKMIKNSSILRNDFIYILDILINSGSAIAFIIREDFISAK